ncbi:MAG: phage head closure protein [Deltaproteobacteria bacterium]|nr:phage head closure protein [Deltaproteobacteria bacterium]
MRAGTLKHKINIQESTQTADGLGGFTLAWSDIYSCRASIWPIQATERLDSMKLELQVTHRIRIRHPRSISITAKHRIKRHDHITGADEYYNIVSVIDQDTRHISLEFLAIEET